MQHRPLKIIRTVEPQQFKVWSDRVSTAPLHFGVRAEALQWFRQAPGTRQALRDENLKIKALMEEMTFSAWQQPKLISVIELAAERNNYLLVGDRNQYVIVKAAQNVRKALTVACYSIYKPDLPFIDFNSLAEKAA